MLRPLLVSFTLTAGILGWVRLLPLGDVQWASAGDLLYWLGTITVGYAALAGARDIGWSSVTAHATMAMNGMWLAVMGVGLSHPQVWAGPVAAALPAVLQAGWALTVWMLPAAVLLARLLRKPLTPALRLMPAGLFGGNIAGGLMKTVQSGMETIGTCLARWRDRLFNRIRILFANPLVPGYLDAAETVMTRWRNAFGLILMAMLIALGWSWEW